MSIGDPDIKEISVDLDPTKLAKYESDEFENLECFRLDKYVFVAPQNIINKKKE